MERAEVTSTGDCVQMTVPDDSGNWSDGWFNQEGIGPTRAMVRRAFHNRLHRGSSRRAETGRERLERLKPTRDGHPKGGLKALISCLGGA
jgi:hypothetical protein